MYMIGHAAGGEKFHFMGPSYSAKIRIKTRGKFGRDGLFAFLGAEHAMEQLI
jgi:hypothetical protein